MNKKTDEKCRYSASKGIMILILFLALCVLTGIVAATTYTAADQNANGQYQIVYTVNPDNSQTFKAAGVAYGTMTVNDPPSPGQTASQDVDMSAQYGYALVAAQDSSGNSADSETTLYNGDANVFQMVGVIQPSGSSGSVSDSASNFAGPVNVPFTGAYSMQCVYSTNASKIIADTDSNNLDGTAADVNAQASGIQSNEPADSSYGGYGGGGCSVFAVHQWAGAFSPVPLTTTAYSKNAFCLDDISIACQEGMIKGADSATVSTSASTPNGLSTLVSATVNGGSNVPDNAYGFGGNSEYMNFDMFSSAKNESGFFSGYGSDGAGPEYKVKSDADITAKGSSGSTTSSSNGPNGQFADVTANFVKDSYKAYDTYGYGSRGKIDIDLSADSILNNDVTVTKAENKLCNLRGYEGNVTASNSDGDNKYTEFDCVKRAGGKSGVVTDTGTGEVYASWARVWPYV
ncbi:MAG TPA: hypothetical protein VMC42_07375 [Methanoregulaceae archaeon]|nr:hypothetical protein [Methanoregulaceae archaeon]